jgi:hypothetical protein
MGYTFNCDGPCGRRYDHEPPFIAEFTETFLRTSDSPLTEEFTEGQTVAMCRQCSEEVFL